MRTPFGRSSRLALTTSSTSTAGSGRMPRRSRDTRESLGEVVPPSEADSSPRRVLIIVQNLPVPFDRRVWLEACALRDAGFQVSVVCPKAPGDPPFQELEGIRIRKYDPPPPTSGALSYAWEFAYCWVRTLVLVTARRQPAKDST